MARRPPASLDAQGASKEGLALVVVVFSVVVRSGSHLVVLFVVLRMYMMGFVFGAPQERGKGRQRERSAAA